MMIMKHRVMFVLAVVLCCACGYTMAAAAVSSPTAVVPRADESSTAMAFGGDILRYRNRDSTDFWSELKAPVDSTKKSVRDGQESTTRNNLGRGQSNSHGHSAGVDRTLGGGESALTEELHTTSLQDEGNTLKTKLEHPQVVESPSVSDPTDQQEEKQKQQGLPNRDDSSSLSPTVNTDAGDSSGPGTTTVALPQSGEKAVDAPERLDTPAQPTISTSSSASVPAESSTISTSSTNNSTGDSISSAATGVSATADTEGTNTTFTPKAFPENTDRQAMKIVNVDSSSISSVWMRSAAPLLIVAVFFSVTVY
ncbi:uncharacterized protein TM35_000951120 [Trypanosoma theileri]|uniref:Mucin TcMUCII n=1 Tax=Trypanosoma theileri TaxID=67003 RepID=A0A1X0NEE0_9TRYP|nr:uncharacterized protein TM35_000951120 [Trypanosoma theileri]ORC82247.1 hypothetical protein TM35_000951120 [Trypanosoma theileri]